ncbi:MAG: hypothetical protein ACXW0T_13165, partial [Methylobacter sp.]
SCFPISKCVLQGIINQKIITNSCYIVEGVNVIFYQRTRLKELDHAVSTRLPFNAQADSG